MSFSLKNTVKRLANDVNPFDAPQPASTARPQQSRPPQFSPVAQQRIMARNPSTGAQQIANGPNTPSNVGFGQLHMVTNNVPASVPVSPLAQQRIQARTGRPAPTTLNTGSNVAPKPAGPGLAHIVANNFGVATGLAAERAGVGLGQGTSGLVDLATPGTGNSRVTNVLNKAATSLDKRADNRGVTQAYKTLQVPINGATFLTPGAVTGGVNETLQGAKQLPTALKVVKPVVNAVNKGDQLVNKIPFSNDAVGRIAQAATHGVIKPTSVMNIANGTAQAVGTQAAHNQKVTPADVAKTAAMNTAFSILMPSALQAAAEGAHGLHVAGKAATAATKEATGQTFNGLQKKQVIMDTRKLDLLHNAKQDLVTAHANVPLANQVNHGLRQLQQEHGLDFVTGSRGERLARIQQYLEQNGEAIPKLQAHQERMASFKPAALNEGGYVRNPLAKGDDPLAAPFQHDPSQAKFKGLQASKDFPNSYHDAKLGDALDYPALFKQHPELKDYTLKYHDVADTPGAYEGIHNPKAKTISLDKSLSDSEKLPALMHEIQHAIQAKEGRLDGQSSSNKLGYHGYKDNPIEVEARQVGEQYRTKPAPSTKLVPAQPREAVSAPRPAAPKTGAVSSAKPTIKARQFAETIKQSDKSTPELKKQLEAKDTNYTSKSNKTLMNQVRKDIGTDYEKAYARATTDVSDRGLATAGELIKLHADRGEYTQAIAIADKAVKNGTEAGRAVQAMALYNKVSPEGIIRYATKQADKSDRKLTPEVAKSLHDMAKEVAAMPDGDAKAMATHKMMELARSQHVSSLSKQLIDVWKAGLLTAPPTHIGNLLGNTIEGATQKALIDPVATGIDMATSLVTRKRSRSLTFKDQGTGIGEGFKRGGQYLKTGYDARNPIGKYDLENKTYFGTGKAGKAAHAYTESVFRILGAADQPFYYRQLRNSLRDQAITAFKNAGQGRGDKTTFVNNYLKEPPMSAVETATNEAKRAVFGNQTALGKRASGLKHDSTAGNFVVPFSGVPASIATRILERSPLGVIKAGNEIVKGVKTGNFNQRAFTGALADAAVGTAGAAVVGGMLANHNLITLGYPTTDQKEQARWAHEKIQPYSIKMGNKYISLNYVQPFGSILAYGAAYSQARKNGDPVDQATESAAGEAAKSVAGQSFLQGVSGAINAVQDPAKGAAKYAESAASGVVPNIIRSATKATDPVQRQVNGIGDAVKQGIPGLRKQLLPKVGTDGEVIGRATSPVNALLNPLKPSNIRTTPVDKEIDRLHNTDPTNTKMDAQPIPVGKSIQVEGTKVNLNPKQRTDLQTTVGKTTYSKLDQLIKTPEYKAMNDQQKVAAIENIKGQATEVATRSYVVNNNLATYNKPMSSKAIALQQGTNDVASLASSKATGGDTASIAPKLDTSNKQFLTKYNAMSATDRTKAATTQNDFEYKAKAAQYANDKANGKLTRAQDISARQSVAKAKIGSSFSKDTRDIYGLSKSEVYDLITSDPNGNKTAQDLLAYGDALDKAGVGTNKFRTSKGAVAFKPKETGSGGSSGKKDISSFISMSQAGRKVASSNQDALLKLVRGAKVSGGNKPRVKVASVTLKKQRTNKKAKATA